MTSRARDSATQNATASPAAKSGPKPEPSPAPVLWGVGTGRTFRAHWALIELGMDYRKAPIRARSGETQTADFTRINTKQKIPVLEDGELVLSESTAIVTYLAERYGGPGRLCVPDDIYLRAHYHEWIAFCAMELDATSLYVLRRHVYLPEIYGEAPGAVETAKAYFDRLISAAANRLPKGQNYLVGETFTGADIVMVSCLDWAQRYGFALPEVFDAYRRRLAERPSYAVAVKANEFA